MNMALGCDVRVAGTRAKFDTRFMQIGIHPGGGHTWMSGGPSALRRHAMVLFGEVLDGRAAERVGLAWRCVDDADLLEAADALAAGVVAHASWSSRRSRHSQQWPRSTRTTKLWATS